MNKNNEAKLKKYIELQQILASKGVSSEDVNRVVEILKKAYELEDQGGIQTAIELYRKATSIIPDYIDSWISIAIAYGKSKLFVEAQAAYDRANEIIRDYPTVNFNLGVLFYQMGREHDALDYFKRERELYGSDVKICKYVGNIYYQEATRLIAAGKNQEALEKLEIASFEYEEAIEKDPNEINLKKEYFEIYWQMNDIEPRRSQKKAKKKYLGMLSQILYPDNIDENKLDWILYIGFNFPKSIGAAVILDYEQDSKSIDWVYVDLFCLNEVNIGELDGVNIDGHLVLNSQGFVSALIYNEEMSELLIPVDKASSFLNDFSRKHYHRGEIVTAKQICKVALNSAINSEDLIASYYNLGFMTLFAASKARDGKIESLNQFSCVSTGDIQEAYEYFGSVLELYEKMDVMEKKKVEVIIKPADELAGLCFDLLFIRKNIT